MSRGLQTINNPQFTRVMKFLLAFRYILDQPGGFVNLLLITACQFIPVVGPIVLLGYRGEVSIALERDPDMLEHPKFDFNRFVDYLSRGVWPFLISLIISLPLIPLVVAAFFAGLAINPPGPGNPPLLLFAFFGGVELIALVLMIFLSVPMTFHAEITGRFDLGGAFRFAWAFWSHVGLVAIGTGFVFAFMSVLVTVIGILCCFVGIYPASSLTQMAGQHLMVQLYRVYLNRGGEPLIEDDRFSREPDELEDEHERDGW